QRHTSPSCVPLAASFQRKVVDKSAEAESAAQIPPAAARMPRGGPELPDRPQRKASARRRAAEQRDELATLHRRNHSITSSARATIVGGMVRPSARAVCRLMTNSNLVGCWTGKWDGSAPLSILSIKATGGRNKAPLEAPYVISPPASANSRSP